MPRETPKPRIIANGPALFWAELPLNAPGGSVRVKRRNCDSDFGRIIPACRAPLQQNDYLEWQIGYDLLASPDNVGRTTLEEKPFDNYANIRKVPSELSELLYWSNRFCFLGDEEIRNVFQTLSTLDTEDYFDKIQLSRMTLPSESKNGILFKRKNVVHPLFIFDNGDFSIEIVIQEQQHGSGIQPMLYLCIPVERIRFEYPCFEREPRTSREKTCKWVVNQHTGHGFSFAFLMLGMLSPRHNKDTRTILQTLFPDLCS